MIVIAEQHLATISSAAELTYPAECCGLLAGIVLSQTETRVTRVVPSENVTESDSRDSFEVDPKIRFGLMRELEGTTEQIVGHYHSHPDHPAEPSETDAAMIYEPELFWLIVSVADGTTLDIRAYAPHPDASGFSPVALHTM